MQSKSVRRKNAGFTLVELLVVIGIIAVLAVIAFPIILKLQNRNLDVMAVNNIRQVGTALFSHSAENNGYFPTARGTLGYTQDLSDPEKLPWQQQLDPYIGFFDAQTTTGLEGPRKIFHLPERAGYSRRGLNGYFLGSHASWAAAADSGEVAAGQDGFLPVIQSRITQPEMHILAGEQGHMTFDEIDADKDDYNMNDPAFGGGKLHRKVAILFADGHVKPFDEFVPGEMTVRYEGLKSDGTGYRYGEELEDPVN